MNEHVKGRKPTNKSSLSIIPEAQSVEDKLGLKQ